MDAKLARNYLEIGLNRLSAQAPAWQRRQDYVEGKQDDPFAPEGVNTEYKSLQKQSIANFLEIAMNAPVQRMQADGFRTGRNDKADLTAWNEIWQPNKLDSRQKIVYKQMYIHGRGIMSVTPQRKSPKTPKIRPENGKRVWIEPNPDDPFEGLFAVKQIGGLDGSVNAFIYTDTEWVQFSQAKGKKDWGMTAAGRHNLDGLPFVTFDFNVDADGVPHAPIDKLMPQQDAINTIRFNTLLAMQFSAYRQRVFTGFDPVARDAKGNPIVQKNPDGTPRLDLNGLPIPVLNTPGRLGVDRALVFPGELTKVFDLPESNLDNYIKVYDTFLNTFFSTGQIPPQYSLTKMANLTGDGMAGAESTFQSLITDLKMAAGESLESVMRLANRARGESNVDVASEVIWASSEIQSFAQIVDGVGKLITSGMSRKDAWSMLPDATPPKVQEWVENSDSDIDRQDAGVNALAAKIGGTSGYELS
ncbi:phage portal protein [Pseudarthrobacter oxydans]|uniref:phage portal protein n=1 Tax=Pseudarthrobacter oxydans TaxID=1671 RepID=UPI003ED0BEC8